MTPRSLFTLLIKLIGLYTLLENIESVPQILSTMMTYLFTGFRDLGAIIYAIIIMLLAVGFLFVVLKYCFFKTDWIIDKLALDKHFEEERFELNMHRSTMLSIAIIVIGGIMFVNSVPLLIKWIYNYISEKQSVEKFGENLSVGWMIFYFIKTFLSYYLMTNSRYIVNIIERKRKGIDSTGLDQES